MPALLNIGHLLVKGLRIRYGRSAIWLSLMAAGYGSRYLVLGFACHSEFYAKTAFAFLVSVDT